MITAYPIGLLTKDRAHIFIPPQPCFAPQFSAARFLLGVYFSIIKRKTIIYILVIISLLQAARQRARKRILFYFSSLFLYIYSITCHLFKFYRTNSLRKKEITMRDTLNEVDEYWTIHAFHIDVKKFTGIILSDKPWR